MTDARNPALDHLLDSVGLPEWIDRTEYDYWPDMDGQTMVWIWLIAKDDYLEEVGPADFFARIAELRERVVQAVNERTFGYPAHVSVRTVREAEELAAEASSADRADETDG